MDVRIPSGIVAEGLDGQGDAGNPQIFTKGGPKKPREARCRSLAQLPEQFAIIEKKSSYHFRDAEYILAMRDGKEQVVMQMAAELNHLLAVT